MNKTLLTFLVFVFALTSLAMNPMPGINESGRELKADDAKTPPLCYHPKKGVWVICPWAINQGEPTMEKVTSWYYVGVGGFRWSDVGKYGWVGRVGGKIWYLQLKTFKLPNGCYFRYQY